MNELAEWIVNGLYICAFLFLATAAVKCGWEGGL